MHSGDFHITEISLGTHSGTHIDAPAHLLKSSRSIDEVPLERLIGACRVLDCTATTRPIEKGSLEPFFPGPPRILLKTRPESDPHFRDRTFLGESGADYLIRHHVGCVGTDAHSIEDPCGSGEIHRRLLQEQIAIIELLDLSGVLPGDYWMAALPLRLEGLDGSPARVVLTDSYPRD